jgi:hypothetical protein
MKHFLVNIDYSISYYMSDIINHHTTTHLVEANNDIVAKEKARIYYENKTIEYDVYFSVNYVEVIPTIS